MRTRGTRPGAGVPLTKTTAESGGLDPASVNPQILKLPKRVGKSASAIFSTAIAAATDLESCWEARGAASFSSGISLHYNGGCPELTRQASKPALRGIARQEHSWTRLPDR